MSKECGIIFNETEAAAKMITNAIQDIKESDQGYGEVKIIIKDRKITRVIVTLDTKV